MATLSFVGDGAVVEHPPASLPVVLNDIVAVIIGGLVVLFLSFNRCQYRSLYACVWHILYSGFQLSLFLCTLISWAQTYQASLANPPWIVRRVSGQPHSAQESAKIRSLHQRGREKKKYLFLSSSRLCLMGWGSSSLEILQVCSCADPGSSKLGTPVAKRCCRGFLEVYRVKQISWP